MKLVIICCHITKIIKTVCWRSCHSWIGCPCRRSKVAGVSVSASRLKHIFHSDITTARRRFKLHFKPVKEKCDHKDKSFIFYYGCLALIYSLNCYPKRNQYENMTPNKFQDLQSTIKGFLGFLEFMNSRNLHRLFVFFLHTFIVPTKFLKSNVFQRKKEKGLTYCVTYLAILNYVKYSTKKIERQTKELSIGYNYDRLKKSKNYGYSS
jgi:hypothetical protein